MCLNCTNSRVKVAKQDIVCYKYLRENINDRGIAHAQHHNNFIYRLKRGTKFTSDLIRRNKVINKGLHSYSKINTVNNKYFIQARFIIPKGTKYHEGSHGRFSGYASEKLVYQEIIK